MESACCVDVGVSAISMSEEGLLDKRGFLTFKGNDSKLNGRGRRVDGLSTIGGIMSERGDGCVKSIGEWRIFGPRGGWRMIGGILSERGEAFVKSMGDPSRSGPVDGDLTRVTEGIFDPPGLIMGGIVRLAGSDPNDFAVGQIFLP